MAAGEAVSQMAAVGFGLPKDVFSKKMRAAPHLLAPTGSDLHELGGADPEARLVKKPRYAMDRVELGTVLAGFHYDLNFLTVHGKSRFPGLKVWTPPAFAPPVPPGRN